ncbi:hypothetical protein NMN56_013350 [Streptomyces iconiensis]|uniref:Uncharacterized protein n=1 Tax=Streptomyces iconiensis TaxID=1384038 RepID=A0ABT6ZVS6_9ACTN|nr:hypothetical protein [Streptomyces iconiensis]MDJ1132927.1 hypothetical protein [Streptomyces iconiensis]
MRVQRPASPTPLSREGAAGVLGEVIDGLRAL